MVSRNPNITWEIVGANIEMPWCWLNLCMNDMTTATAKTAFIQHELREQARLQFRKSDLFRELMEAFWHPKRMETFGHWWFEEDMDMETENIKHCY